jgi:hypothetical protein
MARTCAPGGWPSTECRSSARIGELRLHGNDERMSIVNLRSGTELLRKIVVEVSKP